MQIPKVLNTTVLGIEIFLCLSGAVGLQIAFGNGLGDIIPLFILYTGTIIHLVWTIRIRRATDPYKFLFPFTLFFITTLLICLKATIWRGPEFPWDGSLFLKK